MVDLPERFAEAAPKLRAIFQRQAVASAGSLHMVGLESLRARLGDRWPAVADRVGLLVERLLAQMLGPTDAWFRYDPEHYIVVFASLDREQAALMCAGIVNQLQKTLLGDADTASIKVHSAVGEIGGEVVFEAHSLKELLDAAAHQLAAGSSPREEGAPAFPPWSLHVPRDERASVEVLYRPVWDRSHNVLSIYIARAMMPRRGRLARWGYDCVDDMEDAQQLLELDTLVLEKALDTYAELYRNQFRYFLALPTHFESMATQARRRQYLALLRSIPAEFRPFIYFDLVGLPVGVPASRLGDIAMALKPFCRGLSALVDMGGGDLPALGAAGVQIAHTVLPPGARPARWGVEMARFAHEATRQHLRVSVEGVDVPAMAACAEAAGFHFLSGDAIGAWSEVPEHILRFTAADVHEGAATPPVFG